MYVNVILVASSPNIYIISPSQREIGWSSDNMAKMQHNLCSSARYLLGTVEVSAKLTDNQGCNQGCHYGSTVNNAELRYQARYNDSMHC